MLSPTNLSQVTDGNSAYTVETASPETGAQTKSWFRFVLPAPQPLHKLRVRGFFPPGTKLSVLPLLAGALQPFSNASAWVEVPQLSTETIFEQNLDLPDPAAPVRAVQIVADSHSTVNSFCYGGTGECLSLTVNEVAALAAGGCTEWAAWDLGRIQRVTRVVARLSYPAASVSSAVLEVAGTASPNYTDVWRVVVPHINSTVGEQTFNFSLAPVDARQVRLRFTMVDGSDYKKVTVGKLAVYGADWASVPAAECPNACSGRGACVAGQCACSAGWDGADCGVQACAAVGGLACAGHGTCLNGTCRCARGYTGALCDSDACGNDCWNHGTCVAGECHCAAGYNGTDCRFVVSPQLPGIVLVDGANYPRGIGLAPAPFEPLFPQCPDAALPFFCPLDPAHSLTEGSCTSSRGACVLLRSAASLPSAAAPAAPSYTAGVDWSLITPPQLALGKTVITSSAAGGAHAVTDGDTNTFWQSDMCLATGFIGRADANALLQACANGTGRCAHSPTGSAASLYRVTDGVCATPIGFDRDPAGDEALDRRFRAWLRLDLPAASSPGPLLAVTVRLASAGPLGVQVYGVWQAAAGGAATLVPLGAPILPATAYQYTRRKASAEQRAAVAAGEGGFVAVEVHALDANTSISLSQVAAQQRACTEWAAVDLGAVETLAQVTVRHWAGGASTLVARTLVQGTADSALTAATAWTTIQGGGATPGATIDPHGLAAVDIRLDPPRAFRFVRVLHELQEDWGGKVFVWEIKAWGAQGRAGAAPALPLAPVLPLSLRRPSQPAFAATAVPSAPLRAPAALAALFGVNGIWAFGAQGWSMLAHPGWGPLRYSPLGRHARNYDPWGWNAKKATDLPDFAKMACGGGTNGQWWLNWDWEYRGWRAAGMEVEASLQWTWKADDFGRDEAEVYRTAWRYGFLYAWHFGPTHGSGDVLSVEVGNEPWDGYNATWYRAMLLGLARGAKEADPVVRVYPAAMNGLAVLTDRLNDTILQYIDGINVHAYSWYGAVDGQRRGINPESPLSSFRDLVQLVRLRDRYLPGLPLVLTEWGWDAAPADPETYSVCEMSECVSERAQALYAVRGLLTLARWGLARASWFFYADEGQNKAGSGRIVFSRSGLTQSVDEGFRAKRVYWALHAVAALLGPDGGQFVAAYKEDDDAWVLGLGRGAAGPVLPGQGAAADTMVTHIVAWRPVEVDAPLGDPATGARTAALDDAAYLNATLATALLADAAWPAGVVPARCWWLGMADFPAPAPAPVHTPAGWLVPVSPFPLLVEVAPAGAAPPAPCPANCSGRGVCLDGACYCNPRLWQGPDCGAPVCPADCWNHGTCGPDGVCVCETFFGGGGVSCAPLPANSSSPLATAPVGAVDRCPETATHWNPVGACRIAQRCTTRADGCSGRGECADGLCACDSGWAGDHCERQACPLDCRQHCGFNSTAALLCQCDADTTHLAGADCHWEWYDTPLVAACAASPAAPLLCPHTTAHAGTCRAAVGSCVEVQAASAASDAAAESATAAVAAAREAANEAVNEVAWPSTAGAVVAPHMAVAVAASSGASSRMAVIDGDTDTAWWSDTCQPAGYVARPDANALFASCSAAAACASSPLAPASGALSVLTDGAESGAAATLTPDAAASPRGARAWVRIPFASGAAQPLLAVSVRASTVPAGGLQVFGIPADGSAPVALGDPITAANTLVRVAPAAAGALFAGVEVRAVAEGAMGLSEVAAQTHACQEWVQLDFGAALSVGMLAVRHWASTASGVQTTTYLGSEDGTTWVRLRGGPSLLEANASSAAPFVAAGATAWVGETAALTASLVAPGGAVAATLDPAALGAVHTELSPPLRLRYVRVAHTLAPAYSGKVAIWEVRAWGPDGAHGKPPAPPTMLQLHKPNPYATPLRELMGVCGIWGWGGTGSYDGAALYGRVASWARNYHSWSWDVADPDLVPRFDQMATPTGGHDSALAQDWLNWDWEYSDWNKAGMKVQVSLQFLPGSFPAASFKDPYKAGYGYGKAFATHFGPTKGTGDVAVLEVGNEPWDYSSSLYSDVFLGLLRGAKEADPALRILPAAFPSLDSALAHWNQSHLALMDGLNVHAYSWVGGSDGAQHGIHPESKLSTMQSVLDVLRYRDAHLPGLPVYLTEWGWDAPSAPVTSAAQPSTAAARCDMAECVSERAQALYAVRGLLMFSRWGLARAFWFFYADETSTTAESGTIKFSRSGLTQSVDLGAAPKRAYRALDALLSGELPAGRALGLGAAHFVLALREDSTAWVFGFGRVPADTASVEPATLSHIVAWRPAQVDPTDAAAALSDAALRDATAANATFYLPWPAAQVPAVEVAAQLGAAQLVAVDAAALLTPLAANVSAAGNYSQWQLTVSVFPVVFKLSAPLTLPESFVVPTQTPSAAPSLRAGLFACAAAAVLVLALL